MDRQDRSRATAWRAGPLLLHAAAVVTPAGALLLLGHSGAGKSTVCGLVAERLPTLADDLVRLTCAGQAERAWCVSDAKQSLAPSARSVPLVAVLRLYQSEVTALAPATPRETCGYLLDAAFEVDLQRQVDSRKKRAWFACLATVARVHPGWRLQFALGPETASLLCEHPWA
ncbi:MAG TPA: hypothetical protein PKW05_06420 [Anaerolineae bacterium]|nr:hypothetical protein [Anaerolineae bacterium]HQJ51395.1 hypothetical protein [Anaerolineae bacterium]